MNSSIEKAGDITPARQLYPVPLPLVRNNGQFSCTRVIRLIFSLEITVRAPLRGSLKFKSNTVTDKR